MLTLLQINVDANAGSTGRLAEDIGDVAIENGWISYVAFGRDFHPSRSNLIHIGGRLNIWGHVAATRLFDRHGFASYFATKRLVKHLKEIRPDIIQLHNIHGYFLNLPVLFHYIAKADIPVVWSLHDCWSMTGHCSHFALAKCEKWKNQCYHCPLLDEYPKSWGWDSSSINYKQKKSLIQAVPRLTIVSGSEWIAKIAKESYFSNRSIHVIPDGIDTVIYSPQTDIEELRRKYHLEGKFVIMASGTSWPYYKGLADYAALRDLLDDNFEILIVGMQANEIQSLPKGLIGIPRTKTPNELAKWYSLADCVMSLSRLESFGLTPVEGFACGTPAIVYNNAALPELITEKTGFVVEPGNIPDVKEKVELLRKMGKKAFTNDCRRIALEKYDRYKCYQQYLSLYNSLCAK